MNVPRPCNWIKTKEHLLLLLVLLIPPGDDHLLPPPPGDVALHVINAVNQPQLFCPLRRPEPPAENVLLGLQPGASAGPHEVYEDLVVVIQRLLDYSEVPLLHGDRGVAGGLVGAGDQEILLLTAVSDIPSLSFFVLSEVVLPDTEPGMVVDHPDTSSQSQHSRKENKVKI